MYQITHILAIILPKGLPAVFPEPLGWSWQTRCAHLYGNKFHIRYVTFYPVLGIILPSYFSKKQSTCPVGNNLLL